MSGKKQKSVAGWFSCSKCKKTFSRQLVTKHVGEEDSSCRPVYPYMQKEKLICLLTNVTSATKKIGDLPFIKNKRIASSTIFLSEELIKECGLSTFGWVALNPLTAVDPGRSDETKLPEDNQGVVVTSETSDIPLSYYAFRVWPIPESIGTNQSNLSAVLSMEGFKMNRLVPFTKLDLGGGDAPIGMVAVERLTSSLQTVADIFPSLSEVTLVVENVDEIDTKSFDVERFICTFRRLFETRPIALNNRFKIRFYAQFVHFYIAQVTSGHQIVPDADLSEQMENLSLGHSNKIAFFQVLPTTAVNVVTEQKSNSVQDDDNFNSAVTFEDVGGMTCVINELCSTVKFILNTDLNVPKGILLYGHIGVGKTMLVKAVSNHFKLFQLHYEEFKTIDLDHKSNQWTSRSNSLEKIFKDAITRSPSVIIVEGVDVFAPKKNTDIGSAPITQFADTFSRLASSSGLQQSKTLILCTATNLDRVDPNLRSPKIFAKEIEIPVPSAIQREDILHCIFRNVSHSLTHDDVKAIASSTHGFVAADLRSLCNQATLNAISKQDPVICFDNVRECIKEIKPSAIKTILIDIPNVKWEDIGGQDELKFKLKQAIEWPLKHPESFKRLGINPPKGILMYGPPGCSKTMIAKAIATESGLNFISVKGSELFSKWVGESEKAVQTIFRKARQVAPCVVFFDEIDSLGGERGTSSGSSNVHERVLAQILVEIDGIEALKDVTIVAATNRPDRIDQALLRPGRLDRIIYVPLPESDTRREIFRIRFRKMPIHSDIDVEELVKATEGYSGAEITAVCHEAALKALEENINSCSIRQNHFDKALSMIKPRITQDQIDFYEKYSVNHDRRRQK